MLRSAVKEGTAFGTKAKEYMDAGDLLPDDIIIGIVNERLERDDTKKRGYILDGFPRTLAQAVALIDMTHQRPLDLVIDLDVPREVVLERLASRRVCQDCGTNYSVAERPRHDWTCDFCGGDVVQRADDTEEAINRRLDLYERETLPLIEFFSARDELETVPGLGAPDVVLARLVAAVDAQLQRRHK